MMESEPLSFTIKDLMVLWDKSISDSDCMQQLIKTHPTFASFNSDSLRSKIRRTVERVNQLKRNKSTVLEKVLAGHFLVNERKHTQSDNDMKKVLQEQNTLKAENRVLKRKNSELSSKTELLEREQRELFIKYEVSLESLETVQTEYTQLLSDSAGNIAALQKEITQFEKRYEQAAETVDSLGSKLMLTQNKLSKYKTRNVTKREKRSAKTIADYKVENKHLNQTVEHLNAQIETQEVKITSLESVLEKTKDKMKYEKKRQHQDANSNSRLQDQLLQCEVELENLKKEYTQKIQELEFQIMNSETVRTFEDGKYNEEIRAVLMTLINECNVSLRKVNSVICVVLKGLTGKIPNQMPSLTMLSRLKFEAKFIAQRQINAELMSQVNIKKGDVVTLHNDGTMKHHRQFESYQCTLPDGKTLSMGIQEVSSQSAEKNLAAFKDLVKEMAMAEHADDIDKAAAFESGVISSIQCTMSDQGPSNPKFFELLGKLRSENLPHSIDGWEAMSDEEKQQVGTMYNYYCKLHLLMNFESAVSLTGQELEKHVAVGKNPYAFASEPCGMQRLCKNAGKGLTMTGSDQSGVGNLWQTHLSDIDEEDFLINIEHDRLNTMFFQAAAVYHHQHHIIDFLSSLPKPNNLLKTLLFDVQEKAYIAGIRALGMLDKLVTGPYWRMLEDAENILAINDDLVNLREKLEMWGKDSSPLMTGDVVLFPQVEIHKDALYTSLFEDTGDVLLETYTQMSLELMCQVMLLVLERQARDQLEGGKFHKPSEEVRNLSKAVPTTNMVSERDFGQLDYLNKTKPYASVTCYEAIILWTNNKTSAWLQQLPDDERMKLIEQARTSRSAIYMQFRQRQEGLIREKRQILQDKKNQKEKEKDSQIRKCADVTTELHNSGGLWRDRVAVSENLQGLPQKEKMKALHSQIAFHKVVLKSNGEKKLFQKSSYGKMYDAQSLEKNLLQILASNDLNPEPNESGKDLEYRPIEEVKQLVSESKMKNIMKLRKQRIKQKVKEQKPRLDEFIKQPVSLIGCKVKHNIRQRGEEGHWLDGQVTELIKSKGLATIYKMCYDDLPEEHNEFALLKEMKNGDLVLW